MLNGKAVPVVCAVTVQAFVQAFVVSEIIAASVREAFMKECDRLWTSVGGVGG